MGIELHWRDIIRRPIITEKSTDQQELEQYVFEVDKRANKTQIADAVEQAWPGTVVGKVRVANMPAKRGRRYKTIAVRKSGYRKAIVTLEEGTIDLFEGV